MVEVHCKLKCSFGLDFAHTTAVLLSTASLCWNHLPLSAPACLCCGLMALLLREAAQHLLCCCQRCKFLLSSYYVPRCGSHLNYSCLSMQTSANSAVITHIGLLHTEIQRPSRQTRDFIVFCVCALVTSQWFKDKDVGDVSSVRYKNQLTAECLLSNSCVLSNCITMIDALSGNLILQQLIVELILVALDAAT